MTRLLEFMFVLLVSAWIGWIGILSVSNALRHTTPTSLPREWWLVGVSGTVSVLYASAMANEAWRRWRGL